MEGKKIKVGVNPGLLSAMEHMIPLGRAGTPADAAGAVYLMCIPEAHRRPDADLRYQAMTIPGQGDDSRLRVLVVWTTSTGAGSGEYRRGWETRFFSRKGR